jgi:DNA-directed RNA polymerase specialized sigma24 family protein
MLGLIRHMTDVRRWWFRRGHLADDVPALIEEQQWQLPADATDVDAAVARAFRGEWGRIVATLIRLTGDWDLAGESTQDAFARALEGWGRDGIPLNPGAWLTTTARNRALDQLRRSRTGAAKREEAGMLGPLPRRPQCP